MNTYHEFMNLQQKYLTKQAMLEQEYLSVLKQTGYPVSPEELGSILIQRLITKMENEELPAGKSAVPINRATIEGCEVSKDLASSVLTKKIMKQLGDRIEYNGAGSFIICDGKNDLPKNLGMSRIIVNNIDEKRRPAEASAWLTEECLQKSPSSAAYAPPGYLAQYTLKNGVNLYTRGHLIAATFGNVNGTWNAKTNNQLNIVTQTQWPISHQLKATRVRHTTRRFCAPFWRTEESSTTVCVRSIPTTTRFRQATSSWPGGSRLMTAAGL